MKKVPIFLLVVLLLFQVMLLIHFASKKAGYFVDEVLTYTLSNYPNDNGFVYHKVTGVWTAGSFFQNAMRASGEKKFNFNIPIQNQKSDVHPPLYYLVIHFVASLFPNLDIKWIGIIPNMLFCVMTTVFLYLLGRKLMQNDFVGLLIAAVWVFSIGGLTSAMFVRMYAFLTLWCVLLSYLNITILTDKGANSNFKLLFVIFFVTLCGTLTQYYFLIYAFFLCGLTFIWLLINKNWKKAMSYGCTEFLGIVSSIYLFPSMLNHMFNSYRGGEAFSNLKIWEEYKNHLNAAFSIVSQNCVNGYMKELILGLILIVSLFGINKYFLRFSLHTSEMNLEFRWSIQLSKKAFFGKGTYILSIRTIYWFFLIISSLSYIFLVAKISPYQVDRYYMCIYPLVILCLTIFILKLFLMIFPFKQSLFCIVILWSIITGSSYIMRDVGYLFEDCAEAFESLEPYRSYPSVVLTQISDSWADFTMYDYQYNSMVYRCRYNHIEDLLSASQTKDLTNGFLLYSQYDLSEEDLFTEIKKYLNLSQIKQIAKVGWYPVYFCKIT